MDSINLATLWILEVILATYVSDLVFLGVFELMHKFELFSSMVFTHFGMRHALDMHVHKSLIFMMHLEYKGLL